MIIEIDGQYHNHEERYALDLIRADELKTYQLTVLRFTESEVRKDIANALRTIEGYILEFRKLNIISG